MEQWIVTAIKDIGFPIFVAVYSLVRLEKVVSLNTQTMQAIAVKLGVPMEVGK